MKERIEQFLAITEPSFSKQFLHEDNLLLILELLLLLDQRHRVRLNITLFRYLNIGELMLFPAVLQLRSHAPARFRFHSELVLFIILSVLLQPLVVAQEFLVLLLVLDLLNQQLLEFERRLDELLLDIPEDARVDHALGAVLADLCFLLLNSLGNSIRLSVQLPQIVLELLEAVVHAAEVFRAAVVPGGGIAHPFFLDIGLEVVDDGLQLHLNSKKEYVLVLLVLQLLRQQRRVPLQTLDLVAY
jgi:hypothetical protein